MKNTFINTYRSAVRKKEVIKLYQKLNSAQLMQSAIDNQGEIKFVREDLIKVLTALNPDYYIPFMKYFEGFKYHEIALELNIPIGTVKTRIHTARKLRKAGLKVYNLEFEGPSRLAS